MHSTVLMKQIAAISAVLLGLFVLAIFFGENTTTSTSETIGIALSSLVLTALLALALWLIRRPQVALTVGPEGIQMPIGWREPLRWADIHRIRHLGENRGLTGRRLWLAIDPSPGVLPAFRLQSPEALERWYIRRNGVRLPLHGLDTPPARVIASIERFKPVQQEG